MKKQVNSFCQSSDSKRFSEARNAFDENVTIGNERQQLSISELMLTNDQARTLRTDILNAHQDPKFPNPFRMKPKSQAHKKALKRGLFAPPLAKGPDSGNLRVLVRCSALMNKENGTTTSDQI